MSQNNDKQRSVVTNSWRSTAVRREKRANYTFEDPFENQQRGARRSRMTHDTNLIRRWLEIETDYALQPVRCNRTLIV